MILINEQNNLTEIQFGQKNSSLYLMTLKFIPNEVSVFEPDTAVPRISVWMTVQRENFIKLDKDFEL